MLEAWGSLAPAGTGARGTDVLQTLTLEDLGFAFGEGAFDLVVDAFALAIEAAGPDAGVLAIVAVVRLAERDVPCILVYVVAEAAAMSRGESGFALAEWLDAHEVAPGRLAPDGPRCCLFRRLQHGVRSGSRHPESCDWSRSKAFQTWIRRGASRKPSLWGYQPTRLRDGREKLLAVEVEGGAQLLDEWENIARTLYRDCRRVVLKALYGGFRSKTFRVVSYDADGRRMLPTVLKIGSRALTSREEQANHVLARGLEWTLPVIVYVQMSDWQKKYAAYSAALLCDAILKLERT